MLKKIDKKNKFISIFDEKTGLYARSGMIQNGIDTGIDPFMADFPELIDVGVMGHCVHGRCGLCIQAGIECYQNGFNIEQPNMSLENFKRIVDECKGRAFQFALGGRGDVDQHESFEELLVYCRQAHIVPNFTSSGFGFTDEIVSICKRYCGAVAISWYRNEYTLNAIKMLLDTGVITNIHYVLSNASIEEAIALLQTDGFPREVNAVIFLLHKPVGLGITGNVLSYNDEKVKQFFHLIDNNEYPFHIGFDSCSIPGILHHTNHISDVSLDTCEGGRWSAYISSDMFMTPCSFDTEKLRWAYDIFNDSIENAWNSKQFEDFRNHFRTACPDCKVKMDCMGGCPICPEIVLCKDLCRTTN